MSVSTCGQNIVRIKYSPSSTMKDYVWFAIELQGSLIFAHPSSSSSSNSNSTITTGLLGKEFNDDIVTFKGLSLGRLFFESNGTPVLIIGNHRLEGAIQTLKKPFAIISKNINHPSNENDDSGNNKGSDDSANGTYSKNLNESRMEVVGFIRQVLLFKNRPKPVIANANWYDPDRYICIHIFLFVNLHVVSNLELSGHLYIFCDLFCIILIIFLHFVIDSNTNCWALQKIPFAASSRWRHGQLHLDSLSLSICISLSISYSLLIF